MKIRYRHDPLWPLHFSVYFLIHKDSLPYNNPSIAVKIRILKLIQNYLIHRLHLNFAEYSVISFIYPGSCATFSCHISLVFSNLQQFLSLSLFFTSLTFFEETGQLLCRISQGLFSVFSWSVQFWQVYYRSDAVLFSVSYEEPHDIDLSYYCSVKFLLLDWKAVFQFPSL